MHKIQFEQGRALEKITDEKDYPQRINSLVEEVRCMKERNRALEQRLRVEEKTSKQQLEHIIRLEENIRELKGAVKRKIVIGGGSGSPLKMGEVNKPYHVRMRFV